VFAKDEEQFREKEKRGPIMLLTLIRTQQSHLSRLLHEEKRMKKNEKRTKRVVVVSFHIKRYFSRPMNQRSIFAKMLEKFG
jgi:hypothetical protein